MGKGTYPLRLDPEVRALLEEASAAEGRPMSQLILEGIVMRCANSGTPSSVAVSAALAKLSEAAALLGMVQPPQALNGSAGPLPPAPDGLSWDVLMDGGRPR